MISLHVHSLSLDIDCALTVLTHDDLHKVVTRINLRCRSFEVNHLVIQADLHIADQSKLNLDHHYQELMDLLY